MRDKIILSFDVEDNFTIDELVNPDDWNRYESQVVKNTKRVVDSLQDINAEATFFVVGKTAKRRPEVVKIIDDAGFEVASHGYAHEPVDQMTEKEFEEDLQKSIAVLEDITGKKVKGYRAMAFSINRSTPWAFDVMKRNGLTYDSSLTDTEFAFLSKQKFFKSQIEGLHEIPVCNKKFFGRKWTVSGGVLLRLLPYALYRYILEAYRDEKMCKIIYAHVWEFNQDQPERNVGIMQRLAQSPKTYTTQSKIKRLSSSYEFISLDTYLKLNR
ncbi:MAG: polysaccharide deacetylase family protein [Desulfamplus sp.]|nr:polysaccharide deacetylase family protein [Desulfamplus sp.]